MIGAIRTGAWDEISAHIHHDDVATVLAAVLAATIAAVAGVRAYNAQQRETRRQERAKFYAEAVRAVEDYLEGPYRIRRRDGSPEARREITQQLSDVESRISFYQGWMQITAPKPVATAYQAFVEAAQQEAGPQMTTAWKGPATEHDRDVPLGTALPRIQADDARAPLLAAMKADLEDQPRMRRWFRRGARR